MAENSSKNNKIKKIKVADIVARPGPVKLVVEKKVEAPKTDASVGAPLPDNGIKEKIDQFELEEARNFAREEKLASEKKKGIKVKTALALGILVLLFGAAAYSAMEFLPSVNVRLVTKKAEWRYLDSVVASKRIGSVQPQNKTIPAEIFSQRKNFTFSFKATGKKQVERRAEGKIAIYNSYSSAPQTLVAGTRFASPDGKIFKLVKAVTVPGAKISEGKITSSMIEANAAALAAGPEYNIGPTDRFSIPAFKGTSKYDSFFAASNASMTGGFIGELTYPTDEDIKSGREQALKSFRNELESFLNLNTPKDFKVIDGSRQFGVLKENTIEEVDQNGNFGIFLEAEASIAAFREADLLELMKELARKDLIDKGYPEAGTLEFLSYNLEYGSGRLNSAEGQLSFALNLNGVLSPKIASTDFVTKIAGKNEPALKSLIYSLASIDKATISFWPFWVKSAPTRLDRIKIEVE
ncbi:hypothetical protein HYV91_00810 [Candidatus Wolfebacteria bacterium]|nr:hypothetical protein [Candidatus Wolfebacteria bacterium]